MEAHNLSWPPCWPSRQPPILLMYLSCPPWQHGTTKLELLFAVAPFFQSSVLKLQLLNPTIHHSGEDKSYKPPIPPLTASSSLWRGSKAFDYSKHSLAVVLPGGKSLDSPFSTAVSALWSSGGTGGQGASMVQFSASCLYTLLQISALHLTKYAQHI